MKVKTSDVYPCGVYFIINKYTWQVYIGASCRIKERLRKHKNTLKKGIHTNPNLQKDWIVYGEDAFEFDVFEYCSKEEVASREQYFINMLSECMYNVITKSYYNRTRSKPIIQITDINQNNKEIPKTTKLLLEKDLIKSVRYKFLT